jgi:hypothetical protein
MMEKLSSLIGPERERIQNHNWDCAIFSYGAEANPCSHFGRLYEAARGKLLEHWEPSNGGTKGH